MGEHTDEADLLRRAADDPEALADLYRRYVRRVVAYATRRCASAEDVADVVANTFVRLMRSAEAYDPDRGPVAAFLFTMAANEVAEQRRGASRRRALASRVAGRTLLDHDDVARIDAALDAARSVGALVPVLAALPPGEDAVLRLVADGLSPAEAAAELAITPNAARVRLARARKRVRASTTEEDRS